KTSTRRSGGRALWLSGAFHRSPEVSRSIPTRSWPMEREALAERKRRSAHRYVWPRCFGSPLAQRRARRLGLQPVADERPEPGGERVRLGRRHEIGHVADRARGGVGLAERVICHRQSGARPDVVRKIGEFRAEFSFRFAVPL